jgi:aarF domain-containing kinase
LACFRLLVFSFEKIFDLPMYWTCDSVCDVLYQETDFVCEARNSELVASDFEHLPGGGGVHVPAIFWDTTTKRVMTMEWIEGTPISDLTRLRAEGYKIQEVMHTNLLSPLSLLFRSDRPIIFVYVFA